MKQRILSLGAWLGLLAVLAGSGTTLEAQTVTQVLSLEPGWNAVWLEVEPENNDANAVFGSLPAASVWTRAERTSPAEFIQDPSEQAFNQAGWLGWFPPSRPESLVNSLFAVQANRPYLVKSTNAVAVQWTVTGRPSLRRRAWVPDSLNLRGLPVDPAAAPTFLSFFRSSAAHYQAGSGRLETIYRLNSASGQWETVQPTDLMESGRAYWIYTRGASDFMAPFSARVDLEDGLDYGLELTELSLRLQNHTPGDLAGSMRELRGGASTALALFTFSPNEGGIWTPLPSPIPVGAEAGSQQRLRLAVQRQNLSGPRYESVLDIRDGSGTRLLVPVSADRVETPAGGQASRAGLWVGSATVDAVSEPHATDPTVTTPTRSALNLRLIIHVDAAGQARLLREVTQMWQNGTTTNNAAGQQVLDQPGRHVLLTDESLVPFFAGATVRDGQSVGRRLSSIAYDFIGTTTNNYLNLTGTLDTGGTLTGMLSLPPDHPRNPFKHKFHPDHDNLNARFDGPAAEALGVTRVISLVFASSPPDGPAAPDFGYNTMGGAYEELISGLHKSDLLISGNFRLQRISTIDTLNPSPTR